MTGHSSDSDRKKRLLLLVDGSSSDLFATGVLLQRLEYTVLTTVSGEDALQTMAVALPSAVITEMLLSGMNGMELITRIKQDPRTKDIPVIVHTVMKDPKIEELCRVAGAAAVVKKPADPAVLYRSIQNAIETTPRHYIRLNICFRVVIADKTPVNPPMNAECVTAISENGMFIRTFYPRPVNSVLPVSFFIGDRQLNVRAVVLYCFTIAGGPLKEPGMGMKFTEIDDADRDYIRKFIREQITKDIPAIAPEEK